jgi:hypothetical protein
MIIDFKGSRFEIADELVATLRALPATGVQRALYEAKQSRDWRREAAAMFVQRERDEAETKARRAKQGALERCPRPTSAEARYDNLNNEGGEGYNPYRNR